MYAKPKQNNPNTINIYNYIDFKQSRYATKRIPPLWWTSPVRLSLSIAFDMILSFNECSTLTSCSANCYSINEKQFIFDWMLKTCESTHACIFPGFPLRSIGFISNHQLQFSLKDRYFLGWSKCKVGWSSMQPSVYFDRIPVSMDHMHSLLTGFISRRFLLQVSFLPTFSVWCFIRDDALTFEITGDNATVPKLTENKSFST